MKIWLVVALLLSGCTPAIKNNCSVSVYPIVVLINGKVDVTGLQCGLKCTIWE